MRLRRGGGKGPGGREAGRKAAGREGGKEREKQGGREASREEGGSLCERESAMGREGPRLAPARVPVGSAVCSPLHPV